MKQQGWSTLAVFLLFAAALCVLPGIEDLERWTLDQRFRGRPPRPPPEDIVIVNIDQSQPWTREQPAFAWNPWFGRFIEAMGSASASCVLLDMLYTTSADTFILGHIEKVLAAHQLTVSREVLRDLSFDIPLRQALIRAKTSGLRVVLGFPAGTLTLDPFIGSLVALLGKQQRGFFNLSTDPDKVVRSCVLYETDPVTRLTVPSVSLAVAANLPTLKGFQIGPGGLLQVGEAPVPNLRDDKKGLINFLGPGGTFKMESFQKVLDDAASNPASLARFAGKTVLVGVTDVIDLKMVPTGFMYGIEIHANLIENIRSRSFLRVLPGWARILLLVIGAVLASGVFAFNPRLAGLVIPALTLGWLGLAWALFGNGLVLPCARPVLLLIGGSVVEGIRRYRLLDAEKRKIRDLFGRYVNESVVEDLIRSPRKDLLLGRRRKICVMFSDIRGFTSFSENRDPADVVRFLNTYFGGLTRIIMKHHGVVDKFLGDGLMAFFNSPIERESFASDAVRAALEMRAFTTGEEIRLAADAFPVRVGIALHVGTAIVGNIGSERKVEFTAIGDTVNTASRLEALNKEYHTDIIASEEVIQEARNGFAWKPLGETPIRGKEKPVRLFTLADGSQPDS